MDKQCYSNPAKTWGLVQYRPKLVTDHTDGATRYSRELYGFLEQEGVPTRSHSFEELLAEHPSRSLAGPGSGILSASGPYAYLYHYHREKTGADYPIVRDVHTGAWTGYLMQEWLCAGLTRPGDAVIFPSYYARDLYAGLFPSVAANATLFVGHPRFPGSRFKPWTRPVFSNNPLRIGFIGRLSSDKNLPETLGAVRELERLIKPRKVALHLVGAPGDLDMEDVRNLWKQNGGRPDGLVYWGPYLNWEKLSEFYRNLDLLAFFSTSNIETLGRIVLEARHWNLPTCMARYAAADELVPVHHQVPVRFRKDRISCDNGAPLGRIRCEIAAQVLAETMERPGEPPIEEARYHATPFCRSLREGLRHQFREASHSFPKPRIEIPPVPDKDGVIDLIAEFLPHYRFWMGLCDDSDHRLGKRLLNRSSDPERSKQFLDHAREARINYGDLSGFPFQLAQLAGFRPMVGIEEGEP